MYDGIFSFSAVDLSDAEKLQELTAYVRGCSRVMKYSAERLANCHEFLADDLDGNAHAEEMLRRQGVLVDRIGALARFLTPASTPMEGDELKMSAVLESVTSRARGLLEVDGMTCAVSCSPDVVGYGNAFLLQQVLFGIVSAMKLRCVTGAAILLRATQETLTDVALQGMASDCEPGEYVIVDILAGESGVEEAVPGFHAAAEMLSTRSEIFLELPQALRWLGILSAQGGDFLLNDSEELLAVRMILPARRAAVAPDGDSTRNAAVAYAEMPHGTETILLVDDEDMIWDLVSNLLVDLGYVVILAENGEEAVEIYKSNPGMFDLVIMDMVMPRMNGREAFDALYAFDPKVKVLLSSGYVSPEDAQHVLRSGALGFLRKPYRLVDLTRAVRDILDGKTLS